MRFSIAVTEPGRDPQALGERGVRDRPRRRARRARGSPSRSPRPPRCSRRPGRGGSRSVRSGVMLPRDQQAGQVHHADPGEDARHRAGMEQPPVVVAHASARAGRSPATIAPTPTPNRSAASAGVERGGADPGAEDRRARPRSGRAPRSRPSVGRSSASGETIASPSVVLWIAKPTTRNVPSASAPTAYAEPIASPSPRLCRPIPIATSSARYGAAETRRPALAGRARAAATGRRRRRRAPGRRPALRGSTSAAPPKALGPVAGDLEALERRVDGEEGEQPDRERDQHAQPVGGDAAHERQPEHSEADRDHPDVDAEQRHQAVEGRRRRRASRRRPGSRARGSRRSR